MDLMGLIYSLPEISFYLEFANYRIIFVGVPVGTLIRPWLSGYFHWNFGELDVYKSVSNVRLIDTLYLVTQHDV